MGTYTTPAVHGPSLERIILAVLTVFVVLAVATGARVTWEIPRTTSTDATPTVPAATVERAARVAAAADQLADLRQTVREVPATHDALAEQMELLRLVTAGTLPVAAAESMPTTSVALQQVDATRTAGVVEARRERTALRSVLRSSPSLTGTMAEDLATLEAISRGLVPPETMVSGD